MITTNIKTNKENGIDDLISQYLDAHDILYVDHRKNGGYIFIAGERTLSNELKQLTKAGVHLRSTKNSSVLQGNWAWITLQKLYDCPAGILDEEEIESIEPQGGDKVIALSELANEQLQYICERIPQKVVVDYFNNHSQEYNKIWKGRAQSLKQDRIVRILVTNINNDFISSFVEKCIRLWFSEIKDFRQELEDSGATADESLIRALPGSVFCDDVDLYFLLCDEEYPAEYISLVKSVLPIISPPKVIDEIPAGNNEEFETQKLEREEEMDTLKSQLNEARTRISDLETRLASEQALRQQQEETLATSMSEQAALQASLNTAKEHLSEATHIKAELEQLQLLSRFADTNVPAVVEKEYEYESICRVVHSYTDQAWLNRLADINNGRITAFEQDLDAPRYFGNRDRLFWRDGPDEDGYVGVWDWNAQPNKNDPDTDYVSTTHNSRVKLIEILEVPTCHSIPELTRYISTTQISIFSGRKILFTIPAENGVIRGILCDEHNFIKFGDKYKLNSSVYILPEFAIKPSDILTFSGIQFYRYTSLGLPLALAQVRDPMYVAKEIILSRATSAVLRESGLSKKEAQHCRIFLGELPIKTVAQELAELYACSEKDAQAYISVFIEHADSYLSSEDLDISIVASALERNKSLVEMCKAMLLDEWRQENNALLGQAEQKLADIESQISSGKAEVTDLEAAKNALQIQLTTITADIQSQEQLATSVEEKVANRIAAAKSNVADFICEMAFATSYGSKHESATSSPVLDMPKITRRTCEYVQGDALDDRSTFEEELADNLEKSGYTEQYAYEMSQVISFCICNKLPLVINENAGLISDCIAAMFGADGSMEVTLPITNSDCTKLCEAIKTNATAGYNVFVINGIFDGFSLNAYNELLQNYQEINQRALLILSARGLSMNMIPVSVWNQSFFIDGDLHLTSVRTDALNSFESDFDFTPSYDQAGIKEMRKELKPFRECIGNTAQLNYAMFMSEYDEHVKTSLVLKLQLILASQNSATSDELISAFDAVGVGEEIHKLVSKYQ